MDEITEKWVVKQGVKSMTESKESPQKTCGANIGELCKEQLRRLDEFFALCLHNEAAATANVQPGVDAGKAGVDFRMVD